MFWWLWYKIQRQAEFQSPNQRPKIEIWSDTILDRRPILWNHTKLEVCGLHTWHLNTRIHYRIPGKFQHPAPTRPQYSPHQWTPPNYGATSPLIAQQRDNPPSQAPKHSNTYHHVVVTFLYYACTVEPTIIVTLNILSVEKSSRTQVTSKKIVQLLKYAETHPEEITMYTVSGMVLHIQSDASFLSEPGAKIISGLYHYLIVL